MKNIKVIFLKEIKRLFTDRRMLMALFLPGILIFFLYTLMGGLMKNSVLSSDDIKNTTYYIAYTDNFTSDKTKEEPILLTYLDVYMKLDESKETTNKLEKIKITKNAQGNIADEDLAKLKEGKYSLILNFSNNFEDDIYVPEKVETTKLNFIYKGDDKVSNHIYSLSNSLFNVAYSKAYYSLSGNNVSNGNYTINKVISLLVPMLTISLLYSTVVSICPETFAGEKERGTLANMLLTPMRRSQLVSGKVLALTLTAILSGLVSFVGMITSLPKMMPGTTLSLPTTSVVLLLLVVVSTLILFVTFGTFISSLTKSTKEANSYLGPFSIVFMLVAILPSILQLNSIAFAFIPLVNVSACMSNIISGQGVNILFLIITIAINLLFTGLMVFLTTRVFKKEKFII